MAKKKKNLQTIIIVVLAIFLIGHFGFNLFAILGEGFLEISPNAFNTPEPEVEVFNWGDHSVTATSVFFGSLASGQPALNQGSAVLCGDNDGNVQINNQHSISAGELTLSASNGGASGCGVNWLYANVPLPAGTLTATCVVDVSVPLSFSGGKSLCRVEGIMSETMDIMGWQVEQGSPSHRERTVEFVIEEPTELDIKLETRTDGGSAGASSVLTLSFVETELEQPITYYRNDGTTCTAIPLTTPDVTPDDYLTLEECEANIIIIPDPDPQPPTTLIIIGGIIVAGLLILVLGRKR